MDQSIVNMSVRELLECACEEFLEKTYLSLLGRKPDADGIRHYHRRLDAGFPRQLIIAEIRASDQGREYSEKNPRHDEIEVLFKRYMRVRHLPLGSYRWLFLPKFGAADVKSRDFDWTSLIEKELEQYYSVIACDDNNHANIEQTKEIERLSGEIDNLKKIIEEIRENFSGKVIDGFSIRDGLHSKNACSSGSELCPQVAWEATQYMWLIQSAIKGSIAC